jgi:hypothetical protein
MSRQRPDHPPVLSVAGFKDRESPPRDLEDRWRGERRTIQAVQRHTAEQFPQLGETQARPTGHEFLAMRAV